jgi:hypothetical protein
MASQTVDASFLPPCPTHPYAGVCEPKEDEPGQCAFGEHPLPENLPHPLLTEALASFLARRVEHGTRSESSLATADEETQAKLRRAAAEVLAWLAVTPVDTPPKRAPPEGEELLIHDKVKDEAAQRMRAAAGHAARTLKAAREVRALVEETADLIAAEKWVEAGEVKHGLWRLFGLVQHEEQQLASMYAQCEDAARKLVQVQQP